MPGQYGGDKLQFCQERLGQMIFKVPSNLVFYDSINELQMCMEKLHNISFLVIPRATAEITEKKYRVPFQLKKPGQRL